MTTKEKEGEEVDQLVAGSVIKKTKADERAGGESPRRHTLFLRCTPYLLPGIEHNTRGPGIVSLDEGHPNPPPLTRLPSSSHLSPRVSLDDLRRR